MSVPLRDAREQFLQFKSWPHGDEPYLTVPDGYVDARRFRQPCILRDHLGNPNCQAIAPLAYSRAHHSTVSTMSIPMVDRSRVDCFVASLLAMTAERPKRF